MSRCRLAVSVMPLETRRDVLIAVARMADRLGYDAFFMPETWAHDITVLLAEVALKTERIGIGTGVLGVWNRSPATIAMAAATLAELSHGRFALGLGASTLRLTEGLHDVVYTRPLAIHDRSLPEASEPVRNDPRLRACDRGRASLRGCRPGFRAGSATSKETR
jgi:alkanesulfonate monooxygenase SsuD/methylene tetrahydromethanopterin reductase-like flavin-dependent oxidoreductase (luciferase family)